MVIFPRNTVYNIKKVKNLEYIIKRIVIDLLYFETYNYI